MSPNTKNFPVFTEFSSFSRSFLSFQRLHITPKTDNFSEKCQIEKISSPKSPEKQWFYSFSPEFSHFLCRNIAPRNEACFSLFQKETETRRKLLSPLGPEFKIVLIFERIQKFVRSCHSNFHYLYKNGNLFLELPLLIDVYIEVFTYKLLIIQIANCVV